MYANGAEASASNEAIEWFTKLHSGQATPADHQRFEAWRRRNPLHAKAYAEIEAFWALLDEPAQRVFAGEAYPSRRPSSRPTAARRARRTLLVGAALAATATLLLWLPGALRLWGSDYHTGWGERRELVLQDGSRVTLNTHAALSVDFSPQRRLIKLLEGEAYFQATHDPARPFLVVGAHGMVKVTGTAFNVYEQDDKVTVTVTSGRVRLYGEGEEGLAVELSSGLQASHDARGTGPVLRVDVAQALAWRNGLLVFTLQPLAAVVDELNRYLPGKIVIADPRISRRVVSGAFDLTDPHNIPGAMGKTLELKAVSFSGALVVLY
ncbi:MAG: FecR family protein [Methylococcaceae bacterium]|nr:MAG: FecR family protein [Methylococcaceae bacterium]